MKKTYIKSNTLIVYNICNTGTDELEGFKNIYSLHQFSTHKIDDNSIILLQIHLNWEGRKLSNNYGFEVVKILRTQLKSKAPIVLYSPLPRNYFEQKAEKDIKYKILFSSGLSFLEMPFTYQELESIKSQLSPLSSASLHDITAMLCNLKGIVIDKLNHDLKFGVNIKEVMNQVVMYLSEYQKNAIRWKNMQQLLLQASSDEEFLIEKQKFIVLCNQVLTEQGNTVASTEKNDKLKLLFIDDEQEILDKVSLHLPNFEILTTRYAADALKIIDADIKQEIVAIIADWRLFKDESKTYWQSMQGYEVLEYASQKGIRSLFALTSQADYIVHQIRNIQNIRFSLYKKENLKTTEQYKVFADVLYESCMECIQNRAAMPSSKTWTKQINGISYKMLYINKWNASDRDIFFAQVEEKSDEIWTYILKESNNNFRNIALIKDSYNLEIPKIELDIFVILVLRRIWMGLWYYKVPNLKIINKSNSNEILNWVYQVVCTGMYSKYDGNNANVEQTKLCLKTNEILNKQMLPEEKAWMLKHDLI